MEYCSVYSEHGVLFYTYIILYLYFNDGRAYYIASYNASWAPFHSASTQTRRTAMADYFHYNAHNDNLALAAVDDYHYIGTVPAYIINYYNTRRTFRRTRRRRRQCAQHSTHRRRRIYYNILYYRYFVRLYIIIYMMTCHIIICVREYGVGINIICKLLQRAQARLCIL